jgi:hypothetical protein
MKFIGLSLALLSFSLYSVPLTQQDRDLLKQLHFEDTEIFTQRSFNQLYNEAARDNKKFTLAVVKDVGSDRIFFFDLVSLFSYFETAKDKIFDNPLTRQAIESIRIYRAPAEKYFLTPKPELLRRTIGSLQTFSKPHLLNRDDFEFVDEIKEKPHNGFYNYMVEHAIDTTNFVERAKKPRPIK